MNAHLAKEFSVGQFVFRNPEIHDFYDSVAEAILETQNAGVPPVKFHVRSVREGKLLRVRLSNIVRARCTLSPWHWCATQYTKADPNVVYACIKTHASLAAFMDYYRRFPAQKVMQMMCAPKISVVKLPAQRRRAIEAIDLDD